MVANNLILAKKGESSWVRLIKRRVSQNKNFLGILEGQTGNGKSWAALQIAFELDSEFDPREQLAFDFRSFMKIINNFNDPSHKLSRRKYKIVIYDEIQTSVNKRNWQSKSNQYFNQLISTFRNQQINCLFTTPIANSIDSYAMKIYHAKFQCKGWDKKTKKSLVRPFLLQFNEQQDKIYYHKLYVMQKGKRGAMPLEKWYVKCPPKSITNPYEQCKTAFTNALNQKITQELDLLMKEDEEETSQEELNPESMQPILWEELQNGYSSQEELRKRMEKRMEKPVNISLLSRNLKSMKKKGYGYEKYKTS